MQKNSSRVEINERTKLEELLYGEEIIPWSLHDFRTAEMPGQHNFRIEHENLFHQCPNRLLPNSNQKAKFKVDNMQRTGEQLPVISSWYFSILRASEKNRKTKFCFDCWLLN